MRTDSHEVDQAPPVPSRADVAGLRAEYATARMGEDPAAIAAVLSRIFGLLPAAIAAGARLRATRTIETDGLIRPSAILDTLDGGPWSGVCSDVCPNGSGADNITGGQCITQLYAGPGGVVVERVVQVVGSGGQDVDGTYARHGVDEVWTHDVLDDGTEISDEGLGYFDYDTVAEAWEYALREGQGDASWMFNGARDPGGLLPADH